MTEEIMHDFVIENEYYCVTKQNCFGNRYTMYFNRGLYAKYGTLCQVFWLALGELYNDMNIYRLGLLG